MGLYVSSKILSISFRTAFRLSFRIAVLWGCCGGVGWIVLFWCLIYFDRDIIELREWAVIRAMYFNVRVARFVWIRSKSFGVSWYCSHCVLIV